MDIKALAKSMLIVGLFVGAVLLTSYQFFSPRAQTNYTLADASFGWKIPMAQVIPGGQVIITTAFSEFREPGEPKGLPVRLQIPVIDNTAIEDAYITPDGRMDVPAGSVNVAWYALGPRPGQFGNAVIGGRYGIDKGVPGVFYNLDKMKVGDKAYIVDDKGQTLAFQVRSIRLFNRNDDATPVFIAKDNLAHLNIITCEGIWNRVNDTYPQRRVIFTDAIPTEGPVSVKPLPVVIPPGDMATPPAGLTSTLQDLYEFFRNLILNR